VALPSLRRSHGEFADISVGDPWDKPRDSGDPRGSSLIVVRSARGRAFLKDAIAAGAIAAVPRPLWIRLPKPSPIWRAPGAYCSAG
jgi:coenzyme F420 hydrogenase subunit beta